MTALRRYLLGLAATGVLGIVAARLARPSLREEIAAGVIVGLVVQAPLGWWTLRSIGTERFQLVWVGGMLLRLGLIGAAAVALSGRWETGAFLIALVATLLILLLVEAVTAAQEHSRSKSA